MERRRWAARRQRGGATSDGSAATAEGGAAVVDGGGAAAAVAGGSGGFATGAGDGRRGCGWRRRWPGSRRVLRRDRRVLVRVLQARRPHPRRGAAGDDDRRGGHPHTPPPPSLPARRHRRARLGHRLQRRQELVAMIEARVALLLERAQDHALELRADLALGRHLARRRRRRVHVHAQQRHRIVALERLPAGAHAVQDDAGRVDVGAVIGASRPRLLGRHVARRARDHRRCREGRLVDADDARQAEVEELDEVVVAGGLGEHHVLRLEIAMHHARGVRVAAAPPGSAA